MPKNKRQFLRENTSSPCLFLKNNKTFTGQMLNFSRMGSLVKCECYLNQKFIEVVYQNEKNEYIEMLCAIKHVTFFKNYYFYGLMFIAIQKRYSN